MKISLNWLNDYIDIGHDAEAIAEMLSNLGFPTEDVIPLDGDTVIDVEVSSNRGDCLGHIGLAREISAKTGKSLCLPDIQYVQSDKDTAALCQVEIEDQNRCGRYTARVIEDIKVGPSPDWVVKRLEAVGLRSVNNVVDATNYAMMETGQPPHAFDYDKIADGHIIVRNAKKGEQIVSIDGTQCKLDPDMMIIADPNGPVAVAGVMGGLETEVSDQTTRILLEDAYFDPVTVRTTSRRLGLPSDASFRFERIVDIEQIDWASRRTTQLIIQLAGGTAAHGVVDIYPSKLQPKTVTLEMQWIPKLLGIDIPAEDVLRIFEGLSFAPKQQGETIVCQIPSWRSDIYRPVDLIEEVIRVCGYNQIGTQKKIHIEVAPVDPRQKLNTILTRYLNGCGFFETVNVTFIDDASANLFTAADDQNHMSVKDESRKQAGLLRRTLMPSLLTVLKTNINAGNTDGRFFEQADTFVPVSQNALPDERLKVAMVCPSDFRMLRGVIEGLIEQLNQNAVVTFEPKPLPWSQAAAEIIAEGKSIGCIGIVNDAIIQHYDFEDIQPVVAELDYPMLQSLQSESVQIKPIPRFPSIQRDLSILVDEAIPWQNVEQAIRAKAPSQLESISFVDLYRGKGVADGRKSLTLSLCFRDNAGTLTHEQVDQYEKDIVSNLEQQVSAQLRTA